MRLLAALAAVVLALPLSQATALEVPERYQAVIAAVGWEPADVPMLAAVVECESGWQTFAVGQAGELGLMQFQPRTWEYVRTELGSEAPPVWEAWWYPSAQFYQARILFEEQGWGPWSCARPYA